jgi:hypothetical protein
MSLAPSDPFADHHPGEPEPEGCVCGGGGMVFVDEDYARRHAARSSDGVHMTPGLVEALRYSVFPCYECRPDQYQAWTKGSFTPGNTGSRRRRRSRARRDD